MDIQMLFQKLGLQDLFRLTLAMSMLV